MGVFDGDVDSLEKVINAETVVHSSLLPKGSVDDISIDLEEGSFLWGGYFYGFVFILMDVVNHFEETLGILDVVVDYLACRGEGHD